MPLVLVVAVSLVVTVVADSGAGVGALSEVVCGVVVELKVVEELAEVLCEVAVKLVELAVVKGTVALELAEVVCGVVVNLQSSKNSQRCCAKSRWNSWNSRSSKIQQSLSSQRSCAESWCLQWSCAGSLWNSRSSKKSQRSCVVVEELAVVDATFSQSL
ncbi:unnamed protein product [Prorocentrum cordatum]|uniref:Secreted protein n=1 Tax=Prorocentrum cordatum TaxID=2364126 RepID=A0ABN9YJU0_9DINO|nr:unnamed protein product [Polarella glacialis]